MRAGHRVVAAANRRDVLVCLPPHAPDGSPISWALSHGHATSPCAPCASTLGSPASAAAPCCRMGSALGQMPWLLTGRACRVDLAPRSRPGRRSQQPRRRRRCGVEHRTHAAGAGQPRGWRWRRDWPVSQRAGRLWRQPGSAAGGQRREARGRWLASWHHGWCTGFNSLQAGRQAHRQAGHYPSDPTEFRAALGGKQPAACAGACTGPLSCGCRRCRACRDGLAACRAACPA